MIRSIQIHTLWCFFSQQNMHINIFNLFSLVMTNFPCNIHCPYCIHCKAIKYTTPWCGIFEKVSRVKSTPYRNPWVRHFILFFKKVVHFWTSTMLLLKRIFTISWILWYLTTLKKSLAKESTFLDFILCNIKVYLFKNNICKIIL